MQERNVSNATLALTAAAIALLAVTKASIVNAGNSTMSATAAFGCICFSAGATLFNGRIVAA